MHRTFRESSGCWTEAQAASSTVALDVNARLGLPVRPGHKSHDRHHQMQQNGDCWALIDEWDYLCGRALTMGDAPEMKARDFVQSLFCRDQAGKRPEEKKAISLIIQVRGIEGVPPLRDSHDMSKMPFIVA